ncbi:MAG: hypothetical protein VW127_01590 [Flavobacteriaceae bacterium]|jgi:hypothetical protein
MKKLILILTLLIGTSIVSAQKIHFESGITTSKFDYQNSNGNPLMNLKQVNGRYLAFGYSQKLFTENLYLKLDFNYSSYGSIGSDIDFGNFMEWEVSYAGAGLSFDLVLLTYKKLKLTATGGGSAALLHRGNQIINNTVTGLKGNPDFDGTLFTPFFGGGFSYPATDNLDFFVKYINGKSLDIAKGRETLKFESSTISFGVMIGIEAEKKKHVGITNESKNK